MLKRVLFIDSTHPILVQRLENMGFKCEHFENYNYADYKRIVSEYNGLIIRSGIPINKELLDVAINLKFIGRVGAGLENIDIEYAEAKGILCINAPEGNRDAVGEHTLAMLLNILNRIRIADQEVRAGIWKREENRGTELSGKTIGIIGYGNMGSAFAKRLQGFDVHTIAYDKYKNNYSSNLVKEEQMQTLFDTCDVVSLHIPFTKETEYLVNEAWINKFKKPIFLINTSRGQIVKTEDLIKGIENGKILGACLDVLEFEGKSFEKLDNTSSESMNYLINSNKVILTPHIAGWTHESNFKLANVIADKISLFKKSFDNN